MTNPKQPLHVYSLKDVWKRVNHYQQDVLNNPANPIMLLSVDEMASLFLRMDRVREQLENWMSWGLKDISLRRPVNLTIDPAAPNANDNDIFMLIQRIDQAIKKKTSFSSADNAALIVLERDHP